MNRCLRVVDVTTAPSQSATAPSHAAALSSANPRSSFAPTRTRGAFDRSRGANLARVRGSMGTTSSAPARDSRGDLRQRAAQQAQQPRYTARPGHANAPQPFQGQQNYAAPRYYGQVRAQRDRGLAEDPPPSRSRSRVTRNAPKGDARPTRVFDTIHARKTKLLDLGITRRDSPREDRRADLVANPTPSRSRTLKPASSRARGICDGAHDAHDDDPQPR